MFKKNLTIPLEFANYRLLDKPHPVDISPIKKDNLKDINTSSKCSNDEIEDFLPPKDKDKVLLHS